MCPMKDMFFPKQWLDVLKNSATLLPDLFCAKSTLLKPSCKELDKIMHSGTHLKSQLLGCSRKLRQEDHKFKANSGNLVCLYLKIKNKF